MGLSSTTSKSSSSSSSSSFTGRQRIVLETNKARDRAELLLSKLIDAKHSVDYQETREDDMYENIVNRSCVDQAITTTRKLITSLNQALKQAEFDIDDEDMLVLDELLKSDDDEEDGVEPLDITNVEALEAEMELGLILGTE